MGCRRRSVAIAADFDAAAPWREVIATMDRIRSIATDRQRDAVHVARKVKPVSVR